MEQFGEQFEKWPEPKEITIEEINEELRKAGNYGYKKREDLVSKEETTKVLEEEGAIPTETSFKKNLKRVQEILEKLKEKEKNNKEV